MHGPPSDKSDGYREPNPRSGFAKTSRRILSDGVAWAKIERMPNHSPNPELEIILARLASKTHEIRTLLSPIMGASGLLLNKPVSSEQREELEVIQHNSQHLLRAINNLLDFLKLEAGKLELENSPVDIHLIVDQALGTITARANERNVRLVKRFAPDVPSFILADSVRLKQIIVNLLDNAAKFTNKGEIVIEVTTEKHLTDANPILHFAIHDTGIGISANQIPLLFEPFSQESSIPRKYGTSGMGLTISENLVTLMGGKLWAESKGEGHGATFHFTLPTQISEIPPTETAKPKTTGFYEPEFAAKYPLSILVIDGFPDFVISPIKQLGYEVESVESGFEALGLWQQQAYDVVLLNLHLMSLFTRFRVEKSPMGIETAQRLRFVHPLFHPNHSQPYIIALHNKMDIKVTRDECLAAGMNDYLEHFVKIPELKAALKQAWQALHQSLPPDATASG